MKSRTFTRIRLILAGAVVAAMPIVAASPAHAVSTSCGRGGRPWGYAPPAYCHTAPRMTVSYATSVDGPSGLWWLPAVPTKATGCYSVAAAKLPNGSHAPATWFVCSTGFHTFTFSTNVSGAVVPIRYYYGYSRGGSISFSANPYAAVVLP